MPEFVPMSSSTLIVEDGMDSTELARLIIKEVSGVDDPANQSPGFMVRKAAASDPFLALGVEMERVTKASDSKKPYGDVKYADPGYQKDGKERYPLDTEEHIRAAWSYVNQADNAALYSAGDLAKVKAAISAAMKKLGADVASDTKKYESDNSFVAKVRETLLGAPTATEEDDMTQDELTAALDARDSVLIEKFAEVVKSAVEAPAAPAEGAAVPATDDTPAVPTVEDIQKAVSETMAEALEKALEPYHKVAEATLDRLVSVENKLGIAARKSLDGQEGAVTPETTPVKKSAEDIVGEAIAGAFARGNSTGGSR